MNEDEDILYRRYLEKCERKGRKPADWFTWRARRVYQLAHRKEMLAYSREWHAKHPDYDRRDVRRARSGGDK